MSKVLSFICTLKNGEKKSIEKLISSGFNPDLINTLIEIPAAEINNLEKYFELVVKGKELNRHMHSIIEKNKTELKIKEYIINGACYSILENHFGLNSREIKQKKNIYQKKELISQCSEKEKDIIMKYLIMYDNKSIIDKLIIVRKKASKEIGKELSINIINRIYNE